MAACIDACERAFASYSIGCRRAAVGDPSRRARGQGEIHVKAGICTARPYYAVKVASGFYATEPAAIDGLVMVFDAADGCAGRVPARRRLHHRPADRCRRRRRGATPGAARGRHGCGDRDRRPGRQQLDALVAGAPRLHRGQSLGEGHAPRPRRRPQICKGSSARPVTVVVAGSVRGAVDGADVVITCTASREPLVYADMLAPGAHVTAVGSDGAGKQELDPEILRRADLLVVDSRGQCSSLGELQHALDQADRASSWARSAPVRHRDGRARQQLTVCDLTGLGVQDVAAANVVMANVGERGDHVSL